MITQFYRNHSSIYQKYDLFSSHVIKLISVKFLTRVLFLLYFRTLVKNMTRVNEKNHILLI